MKDHGFIRNIGGDASVSAPHFDDERTLLTARRVVPLEKIAARVMRRRRWFLGGAFAAAMILGAASALLASYLRLRSVNTQASEITQTELAPAPLATATEEPEATEPPAVAVLDAIETLEEPDPEVVPETPRRESRVRRRTVSRPESDIIPSRDLPRLSEEDELERIRAAVLYNEWQERRQRRALRRDRRRTERDSRDLSNLDEIFEGPRRP